MGQLVSADIARPVEAQPQTWARVRRRQRRATVATFAWIVAALAAGEGGLRFREHLRHGAEMELDAAYQAWDAGRPIPEGGVRFRDAGQSITINALGFRGGPIGPVKPPGVVRIAAVGGSVTFGMNVPNDDAVWVCRLASRLHELHPDAVFEPINAGRPGNTLDGSVRDLRDTFASLGPDIIVIYHGANDLAAHSNGQFPNTKAAATSAPSLDRFVVDNSLLLTLIKKNAVGFRARHFGDGRHDRLDDAGVARFDRGLREIVATCRGIGATPVLCTFPRLFGRDGDSRTEHERARTALGFNPALSLAGLNDAYERYNGAIRGVAADCNVQLVDLDHAVPRNERFFLDSVHLTAAGHDLVGALVADAIDRADLIWQRAAAIAQWDGR